MPKILVTPLSAVPDAIRAHRPSHMVTLLAPEHMIDTPPGVEPKRHLRLAVQDVAEAQAQDAPAEDHVRRLIAFARDWDAEAPLLVHCWAGISRSMAASYAILCDRLGPGHEIEIARAMRARAPHCFPNRLIVHFADHTLGRDGRMIGAIDETMPYGSGTILGEGVAVSFPLVGL